MFIADLMGLNVVRSVWSNFERMEGWVTLVHLFGLFLLFDRVLFDKELWVRWIQASLGVSLLVGVHGVMQLLGFAEIHQGGVRLDANFGNATYLAVYTLFHAGFAAWFFFRAQLFAPKVLYVLIGGLNILLLYFSGTRGALLGLIAGVLVGVFVYAFATKSKKLFAAGAGLLLAGTLGFGILAAYKESPFIKNDPVLTRIAQINLEAGETRFAIWNIALQGFYERPLLGWGQGNFNLVFSKYYKAELYNQEPWFDRAHNVFFDWLIAGGIVGLGAYLLLFGSLFWFLFVGRFDALEKAVGVGVLAGYGVNNLFVFDNLLSYIPFVFLIAFVSSRVVREYPLPTVSFPVSVVQSLIIIIGIFVIYSVNVPALNANGALLRGLSPQFSVEERRAAFAEALSYNSFADQEIREQMVQVALRGVQSEGLSDGAKIALLADAAVEMEKQVRVMPESARIHLLYGIMLRMLGNLEQAEEVLERAHTLAPEKQTILFELGVAKDLLGKEEEAIAAFERAYVLDTSYEEAERLYEAVLEKYGKSAIVLPK